MITSTVASKYAVVRSFGSSSIVGCSEKCSVITKSFKSYSELVSWCLNESTCEEIYVNELEEPSSILSAGRCDNYDISYSEKSAKIL